MIITFSLRDQVILTIEVDSLNDYFEKDGDIK